MRKASAYGFTVSPDQHWSHAAACAQEGSNPEMWFSGGSLSPQWVLIAQARHICWTHCPVRRLCKDEIGVLRGGVVGGTFYNEKGQKSDYQPMAGSCARCRRG